MELEHKENDSVSPSTHRAVLSEGGGDQQGDIAYSPFLQDPSIISYARCRQNNPDWQNQMSRLDITREASQDQVSRLENLIREASKGSGSENRNDHSRSSGLQRTNIGGSAENTEQNQASIDNNRQDHLGGSTATLAQQAKPEEGGQQRGQAPQFKTPENRPWGNRPPFAMHHQPPGGPPQPMAGNPPCGHPNCGQAPHGHPGFGHPGFGQPGFGHPGFINPGHGNPGQGHPGYGHPGYGHPGNWLPPPGHPPPQMAHAPPPLGYPPAGQGQPYPNFGQNQAFARQAPMDRFDYVGIQHEVGQLYRVVGNMRSRELPESPPPGAGPPYTPCPASKNPARPPYADLEVEKAEETKDAEQAGKGAGQPNEEDESSDEISEPSAPRRRAVVGRLESQKNKLPPPPTIGAYTPQTDPSPHQPSSASEGDHRQQVDIDEENEISRRLGETRLRGDALAGRPDIHVNIAKGEAIKYFYKPQTKFLPRTRAKEEEAQRIRRAFANKRAGRPNPPELQGIDLTIRHSEITMITVDQSPPDRDPSSKCVWVLPLGMALKVGGTRYSDSVGPNSRVANDDPFTGVANPERP